MERIDIDEFCGDKAARHSSRGYQLKWKAGEYWYKADHMGYESLAEIVVSRLLRRSDVPAYVRYEPARILYGGKCFQGCKSRNFLGDDEELVTAERLIRQFTGRDSEAEMAGLSSVRERIRYLSENVAEITGLSDFGKYLTAALEIDAVFLNEGRDTGNLAVIYRPAENRYRLCPFFDHGLALFSDTSVDFGLDKDTEECRGVIRAKPFSTNFDEQKEEAEALYGRQLRFSFREKEVLDALEDLTGFYHVRTVKRVAAVLTEQIRRYPSLFSGQAI